MAQHSYGSLLEAQDQKGPAAAAPADKRDRWGTIKIVGSIAALLMAAVVIGYQMFGGSETAATASRRRDLLDSETLEVFRDFGVEEGTRHPWKNPKTGKNTLYPAERCFWTKDGKAKAEPTYVLLNQFIGKPGDTMCPDCGRKVIPHNPTPPIKLINEALGVKEEQPAPPAGGK